MIKYCVALQLNGAFLHLLPILSCIDQIFKVDMLIGNSKFCRVCWLSSDTGSENEKSLALEE